MRAADITSTRFGGLGTNQLWTWPHARLSAVGWPMGSWRQERWVASEVWAVLTGGESFEEDSR